MNKKWIYSFVFITPLAFALFVAWLAVREWEKLDEWNGEWERFGGL